MSNGLPLTPAAVAAAKFKAHLEKLYTNEDMADPRLAYTLLDDLNAVIPILARKGEDEDLFYVRLGAEHYDAYPPLVTFVEPDSWAPAAPESRWFPKIEGAPNFGLHDTYEYKRTAEKRPLICFSFNADYYVTDHNPTPGQTWVQGNHTVAATIYRLTEIMQTYYTGRRVS